MSLTSTLSNAVSGLNAAQTALATTANNVANVNTPGYGRKVVQQETRILAGQGAGVRSLDVTRITDQFVTAQAREQATRLGRSDVLAGIHERIQDTIFGEPGDAGRAVGDKLTNLLVALDALAASPEQAAARTESVGRISEVLQTLDSGMAAVQTMRRDADQQIAQVIGLINTDLAEIAAINQQFVQGNGFSDLEDRRDQLLANLAGMIDIQVGWQGEGQVEITTRAGIPLLDGEPRRIVYTPASSTAADSSFGQIAVYRAKDLDPATGQPKPGARLEELISAGTRATPTPELLAVGADPIVSRLRGGSLQGLIEARDRVLPELADQLAELGSMLRYALNAAHNDSAASPPPTSLTGTRIGQTATTPLAGTGTTTIALVDRTSGEVSQAFRLDVGAFASVGDLLAGISTASGGAVSASLDATGRLVLASSNPALGIAIDESDSSFAVVDAAGHARSYGFSHYFGLNDLVLDAGNGRAGSLRADIAADEFKVATARLDVAAGPPVIAMLGGKGDARGAAALASALRTPVATIARGGLPSYAATPNGYAADITSLAAAAASEAARVRDGDQALATDLAGRLGNLTGVNLDEEMSRLILYQQAYTVSARIISITDDLFGELMQIAG
jgi:flagellar hook-associated protein 1 FlgK